MGRRKEQRAARQDAARAAAEHPVFDAPQRAEDAATMEARLIESLKSTGMCDDDAFDGVADNIKEIHDAWIDVHVRLEHDDSQTLSDLVMKIVDSQGVEEDVDNIRHIVDHYDNIDTDFKAARLMGLLHPLVQKVSSASDQAAPTSTDSIMVVQQRWPKVHGPKVQGTNGTQSGTKVRGTMAMGLKGILGTDLGGMQRLPKPRSAKDIDEIKWSSSRKTALSEVVQDFNVPYDVEEYYSKMCSVGQHALVNVVHTKTQAIYDATMSNLVKRQYKKYNK